ncbi:hypothetical protein [Rhodoferax sp. UBA5149]|uniref:hypothetical protein n=1 Tax=Rhodoferax sp. UBA5149 TaxID=1947379 RepID=UPI0025E051F0|nr:hypothetical protein [Rhodoferax sp. UBA5149]
MNTQAYHTDGDQDQRGDPINYQRNEMLREVAFKWLMAGLGRHVDPALLKSDAGYANACFQFALNSDCDPLRSCAVYLRAELDGITTASTCSF